MDRPLRLDQIDPRIDGDAVGEDAIDTTLRHLSIGASGWETFSSELSLGLDGQAFPSALESVRQAVEAVAVLASEAGFVRIPVRLERKPGPGDVFSGRLSVTRAEVGGVGRLEVEMIAEISGVGHRVIGAADPWSIRFDETDAPVAGGESPITMVWVDFSTPPAGQEILSSYADNPVHLSVDGAEPVIYLNSGLKAFQTVLSLDHAKGARKTVRDLMGAWMGTTVVLALARAGLRQLVVDDDGTVTLPDDPVVGRALDAIVGEMQSVETVQQMAERLAKAEEDPSVETVLWAEVFLSAYRLTGAGQALNEASERVLYE